MAKMHRTKRSYPLIIQNTNEHPIPKVDRTGGKKRISKYAFLNTLQVRETVFLPTDMFPVGSVNACINKCQKATGFRFTTRITTEDGMKGLRIWRTE